MREFQFLVPTRRGGPKDGPARTKENTLLLAIPAETARRLYIIWSQQTYHYYAFETIAELEKYIADTPQKDRCFYEVIFGESPQHIKFDIDRATADELQKIMSLIKTVWKGPSVLGPYENRRNTKMHVYQTGPTAFHVVIAHCVANVDIMKNFLADVIAADTSPGKNVSALLDTRVYSRIQNFRIIGSHKKDKEHIKQSMGAAVSLAESLITCHKSHAH